MFFKNLVLQVLSQKMWRRETGWHRFI